MFLIPITLVRRLSAKWYEYLAERCTCMANRPIAGHGAGTDHPGTRPARKPSAGTRAYLRTR